MTVPKDLPKLSFRKERCEESAGNVVGRNVEGRAGPVCVARLLHEDVVVLAADVTGTFGV